MLRSELERKGCIGGLVRLFRRPPGHSGPFVPDSVSPAMQAAQKKVKQYEAGSQAGGFPPDDNDGSGGNIIYFPGRRSGPPGGDEG